MDWQDINRKEITTSPVWDSYTWAAAISDLIAVRTAIGAQGGIVGGVPGGTTAGIVQSLWLGARPYAAMAVSQ